MRRKFKYFVNTICCFYPKSGEKRWKRGVKLHKSVWNVQILRKTLYFCAYIKAMCVQRLSSKGAVAPDCASWMPGYCNKKYIWAESRLPCFRVNGFVSGSPCCDEAIYFQPTDPVRTTNCCASLHQTPKKQSAAWIKKKQSAQLTFQPPFLLCTPFLISPTSLPICNS